MASVVNEGYDASGTLTSRERTGYGYDSKSYRVKLTSKTDTALDGNFTLSSTTEFLASHRNKTGYAQTLQESKFDADGNLTKQIDYTFGDDEIAQRTREFDAAGNVTSDQTLVFGHDGHGSVRVLYDLSGTVTKIIQAFTFSAYGQMTALHNTAAQSIAVSSRLSSTSYSGETFDAASQQQYLRARFYNSANGRFNRLDPFAGSNQDPQSLHKYAYVHGDPIQGIDPTGLRVSLGVSLAVMAIAAIGIGIGFRQNTVRRTNEDGRATVTTGAFQVETIPFGLSSGLFGIRLGGVPQKSSQNDGVRRYMGGEQPVEIGFTPSGYLGSDVSFVQLVRNKYNTASSARRMQVDRSHPQAGPEGWRVDSKDHPHMFYGGERSDSRMGPNPFTYYTRDAPSVIFSGPAYNDHQLEFMTLAFSGNGNELHFIGGIEWTVKFTDVSYPQMNFWGMTWSQNANATEVTGIRATENLPQETIGAVERFYASRGNASPFVIAPN